MAIGFSGEPNPFLNPQRRRGEQELVATQLSGRFCDRCEVEVVKDTNAQGYEGQAVQRQPHVVRALVRKDIVPHVVPDKRDAALFHAVRHISVIAGDTVIVWRPGSNRGTADPASGVEQNHIARLDANALDLLERFEVSFANRGPGLQPAVSSEFSR